MTHLAPYAADPARSRGRRHPQPAAVGRDEFQRDRDRIIHCAAFRRLEYKTQVFVNHEGDHYRTRLTHSIEVAQIGRSVANRLRVNEALTEAICLAHDLGHTPFGHAGQDALNDCMRDYGGFEHNLQSLRVVDELEERYAEFNGLNLTFETREGILKHCSPANARQLGDVGERFLRRQRPSLEAQIANITDEIGYNNHDVDDGIRSGLITVAQLADVRLFGEQLADVRRRYPDLPERRLVHETIRRMIDAQINDLVESSGAAIAEFAPRDVEEVRQLSTLVHLGAAMVGRQREMKQFLYQNLYRHPQVERMNARSRLIVRALFAAYQNAPGEIPADFFTQSDAPPERTVADWIAGMTDRFAIQEYERLYGETAFP